MQKWIGFIIGCAGLVAGAYYLTLPPEQTAPTQRRGEKLVETEPVRTVTITDRIEALGSLRANEEVTIVAESQGVIKSINFEQGSLVQARSTLIALDSEEEKALLEAARAVARESERQYARLEELAARNTVSQARLDEQRSAVSTAQANVRVAQVRLSERFITAPFTGRIGLRAVSPGDLLQVGSSVATLDDDSVLKIIFDVPEKYLSSLKEGLSVSGMSAAYPGEIFMGQINRVDTRVDALTRTIDVQAIIPNDDKRLKPGLSMTVELFGQERSALLVNETAILALEDRQYVFIIEDTIAKRRRVDLGVRFDGEIEVISGISSGDMAVVKGLQGLSDGMRTKTKETSQQPGASKDNPPSPDVAS